MNRARGRPFEPGNKLGRGRPKGSRNRTKAGLGLLDEYRESVIRKCIIEALNGDLGAMRLCMERISPVPRGAAVRMKLPRITTVSDVSAATETLVKEIARGKITPLDGQILSEILDHRRRAIEAGEISARVDKLEEVAAAQAKTNRVYPR